MTQYDSNYKQNTQNLSNVSLSGDVIGTAASATVVKIQNRDISSTSPADTNLLVWSTSNNKWNVGSSTSNLVVPITYISGASYTVQTTDATIINNSAINTQVNFPASATVGRLLTIVTQAHSVNLIAHSGTTISELSSYSIPINRILYAICYDGTNWVIIN